MPVVGALDLERNAWLAFRDSIKSHPQLLVLGSPVVVTVAPEPGDTVGLL